MPLLLVLATIAAAADPPNPTHAAVLYVRGEVAAARSEIEAALARNPADASGLFAAACFALESTGLGAAKDYLARLKQLSPTPPQAEVLEALISRRAREPFEPIEDALAKAWKRAGRPDLTKSPLIAPLDSWSEGVIPPLETAALNRMTAADRLLFASDGAADRLRLALVAAGQPEQNPLVVNLDILEAVAPYEPLPAEARADARRAAARVGRVVAKIDLANGYLGVAAWLASSASDDAMSSADLTLLEAAVARPRFEVPRRDLLEQLRVLATRFDPTYGELRARSAAMGLPVPLYRLRQRAEATRDVALRRRAGALLTRVAERLACSGTMLERMLGVSLAGKGAALSDDATRRERIRAEVTRIQASMRAMTEAQKQLGLWPFAGPWRNWDADREVEYFQGLVEAEPVQPLAGLACPTRPEPRRTWAEPGAGEIRKFHRRTGLIFSPCSDDECLTRGEKECRPSHLFRAYHTIEGTPAFMDLFVLPNGKACRVVVFGDFSRDYGGGCLVSKRTCPTVAAATSDHGDTMGCTPNESLFEARTCQRP